MAHKHSHLTDRGRCVWYVDRLIELARHLPVKTVPIASIAAFDQNCWFDLDHEPTCRAVAAHAQRIHEADLTYPIILASDGQLMDGGHRIAKAWLQGMAEIQAVQFEVDPEPDEIRTA